MEPASKKDKRYLNMATQIALTSECRMKHGAVVVHHGKVRGRSPNLMKNNPKNVTPIGCSVHAEVRALRKAGFPTRATVYVARVNNQGELRYSRPCAGCMSLIEELKCKAVWT